VVDSFDKNSDYLFVDVDERTVGNFGGNLRCLTVGKEVECVCVDTGLVGACGNATVNSTVGEDGTDSIVNVDDWVFLNRTVIISNVEEQYCVDVSVLVVLHFGEFRYFE
jgi:glyoxylase-like metal-dependent hydrolase (beta-lactamase superfamily II)